MQLFLEGHEHETLTKFSSCFDVSLYYSKDYSIPLRCPWQFLLWLCINFISNFMILHEKNDWWIKVSKSRKQFIVSWILPKNERNSLSWTSLLRIVSFICFLGESRRPWIAFEIYWPLASAKIEHYSSGSRVTAYTVKKNLSTLDPTTNSETSK